MHYVETEHSSYGPTTVTGPAHDELDAMQECDFCGDPVARETAVTRPGGDGGKPVVLCTKCEFGID